MPTAGRAIQEWFLSQLCLYSKVPKSFELEMKHRAVGTLSPGYQKGNSAHL